VVPATPLTQIAEPVSSFNVAGWLRAIEPVLPPKTGFADQSRCH
jgi:hypothetical protein